MDLGLAFTIASSTTGPASLTPAEFEKTRFIDLDQKCFFFVICKVNPYTCSSDKTEVDITPSTPQKSTFSGSSPLQIIPFLVACKASLVIRKRGKAISITIIKRIEEDNQKNSSRKDKQEKEIRELTETQKCVFNNFVTKKKTSIEGLYCEDCATCSAWGKLAHYSCADIDDKNEKFYFIT